MKKILKALGLVFIGFILGIVVAPKGDNSKETVKEVVKSEETAKTETKSSGQSKKESAKPVEKAPTQVFEDDRVKISFVKLDTEGVKFLVENKTNVNITIQADSVSVNGFSANKIMMSDNVAPNSKGFVTARTSELKDVGSPEKVSGSLRVIDFKESFKTYNASFTEIAVQ
ncbi:hypothetical protein [Bacillus mycoides]|uniref:hypothetical protein n=1 Tax=Bacillus mycoides TaxID=1405 RepID=UPI003D6525A5